MLLAGHDDDDDDDDGVVVIIRLELMMVTQVCKGGSEGAWLELEAERSGCNCCLQVHHHITITFYHDPDQ